MANTTALYARIDSNLKENAENILQQLGISPTSAIQMFYSQIVLTRSLPLNLKLPIREPVAIGGLTHEQIDAELYKGLNSMKNRKCYTPDEIDDMLEQEFGT